MAVKNKKQMTKKDIMKQKAPDKIFVGIKTDGVFSTYTTVGKNYPGAVEYISKEALIDKLYKWFEEDTTVADYYTKEAFAKVVDKLFSKP